MYGITYKSIKEYIVNSYGIAKWETIEKDGNITIDFSLMEQPYSDATNYKLAVLTTKHTGKPLEEVLFDFGEYIIKATSENYSVFMESRGNNLRNYLINLPNFHNRIMLIYPELTPPEFRVSSIENNCILLHYISTTPGMLFFIKGYLTGLMNIFKENPNVEVITPEDKTDKESIFKICW
ncbi:heme NO-binding protein [Flavobacterium arcticum]|uniref:Heme NO-binding protein n=1 Tax=Flavobacterium arcticum TaxID=1784713 RepID=A0A345H8G9_9FLAO|nr:heme NO-binding domain-containing protein [Flavobacterium arcticum]AXG72879.1 heme NO-binding protein [Flavobacterium arcticum]KAF2510458.1 heme NO-binding protein [Flavobacterium arcticum]